MPRQHYAPISVGHGDNRSAIIFQGCINAYDQLGILAKHHGLQVLINTCIPSGHTDEQL